MGCFLTVIIPVYNDADNILRCLDSLFNQSIRNFEIIVVNDASTDRTKRVLEEYQQTHYFQIINLDKNSGAGYCRNVGIQLARTPYVTFVDSDDWIDISTYEKCFRNIGSNPDVVVYGLIYDYVEQNVQDKKYQYLKTYTLSGDFALNIYAHTIPNEIRITPIVNNKIYSKCFLEKNNLLFHPSLRYQEDDAFTFEVLARAENVVIVSDCNYHYCQRNNSMIHCVSDFAIDNFIEAYLALKENLESAKLFDKYKVAFYLKLKGSAMGVLKRIIDYDLDVEDRNRHIYLLLTQLLKHFDSTALLKTLNFQIIRGIL